MSAAWTIVVVKHTADIQTVRHFAYAVDKLGGPGDDLACGRVHLTLLILRPGEVLLGGGLVVLSLHCVVDAELLGERIETDKRYSQISLFILRGEGEELTPCLAAWLNCTVQVGMPLQREARS